MLKNLLSAAVGTAVSVGIFFLVFCVSPEMPEAKNLAYRLGVALRSSVFPYLFILLPSFFLAFDCLRGKMKGGRHHSATCDNLHKHVLDNTLKTFFVFFIGTLTLSVFLTPWSIRIIPAITTIFCYTRLSYWLGCLWQTSEHDYWKVSFAKGTTFILNTTLLITDFVLFYVFL